MKKMKKTVSAIIFGAILTSCSSSHLNKITLPVNCEGIFSVEETANSGTNFNTVLSVDTVIDDFTPMNPDALMPANFKCVKLCLSSENIDYGNKFKLSEFNLVVHDSKTNKDYTPTLRDNESSFKAYNTFIIIDVPNETNIEDLQLGLKITKEIDYSNFISLKNNPVTVEKNKVVKLDSVTYVESYEGKLKVTLKNITYNVDDNDPIAKKIKTSKLYKIVKVDAEYELVDGEKGSIYSITYLFTQFRISFNSEKSADLPFNIEGKGTKINCSHYFAIFANEKVIYITDAKESANVVFTINPPAKQ